MGVRHGWVRETITRGAGGRAEAHGGTTLCSGDQEADSDHGPEQRWLGGHERVHGRGPRQALHRRVSCTVRVLVVASDALVASVRCSRRETRLPTYYMRI